jgi:predicted O-methyltransferase YrrM
MHQVEGQDLPPTAMTEMETLSLERCARDKVVLELGAEYGYSTMVMGRVAKRVVSVDWHRGYPNCIAGPKNANTLYPYLDNIKEVRVSGVVLPVVGRFEDVLPFLHDQSFEFIFLDGGHDFEQAVLCFTEVRRLLVPDGVFACHDYGHPLCPERAVAESLGVRPRSPVVGTLAIFDDYAGANWGGPPTEFRSGTVEAAGIWG